MVKNDKTKFDRIGEYFSKFFVIVYYNWIQIYINVYFISTNLIHVRFEEIFRNCSVKMYG